MTSLKEDYLSATQIARIFDVSANTVYNWRDQGKIKVDIYTPSGRELYSMKQIEDILSGKTRNNLQS